MGSSIGEVATSSEVDACEACRCPNVGQRTIVSLRYKNPEAVDKEVPRAATKTNTLECMRMCRCQGSYQANAALHSIFKFAKVGPARPIMVGDVHEALDQDAMLVPAARCLC